MVQRSDVGYKTLTKKHMMEKMQLTSFTVSASSSIVNSPEVYKKLSRLVIAQ